MLSKWERQTLNKLLQGLKVPKTHLKVVRSRIRKKLAKLQLDLQLIAATVPDLLQNLSPPSVTRNSNQLTTSNQKQLPHQDVIHAYNSSKRSMHENSASIMGNRGNFLVKPRAGFEPAACGLRGRRSTS